MSKSSRLAEVHEGAGHGFVALALGAVVPSVEVHEDHGFTRVGKLSRRKRLMVAVAGRVAGRIFGAEVRPDACRPDYVAAFECALSIVDATEAVRARRFGSRAPEEAERRRLERARRLVDLAEEHVGELLTANRAACEHLVAVLAERGRLDGDDVVNTFNEAMRLQEEKA